ncbi:hypothetical protein Q4551_15845 [Oceanobacter sp. 5_MG-2023]|uniref:hypothetical protein n=1 Tax=Oceanobacter sp. 5_MG-2023 TaxID=3062645 RepID=UPI0026E2080B|nr:hypothetical protein [Oceanobacter sp. 5_MG-2023]MDO6683764.1 hypothetical protein [Oceanobacter sp. 5_MG-2023]
MAKHKKQPVSAKLESQNHVSEVDARSFSLTMKRSVTLKRYPMIAQLAFFRGRPDLVSLLAAVQNNYKEMPNRLVDYLSREKLWDRTDAVLTSLGEEVKATGCFNIQERGFYHIWYTDSDSLLGTRPMFIQRDTAFFEPKQTIWKKGIDAKNSQFKFDGSEQRLDVQVLEEILHSSPTRLEPSLGLSTLTPEVICSPEKEATIQLSWKLGFSISSLKLQGQIETLLFSNNRTTNQPHELDISIDGFGEHFVDVMEVIAQKCNGIWHQESQRVAVELETIKHDTNAVQRFVLDKVSQSNLTLATENYSQWEAFNLPIKPINQQDAKAWHQHWLENYYRDVYQPSASARKQQATWLDQDALQGFELPLYHPQNLLAELSRDKQPKAYWHAAALADLTPSKSRKSQLAINLVEGDALDLTNLMHQLCGDEHVKTIIYSDRYVHTPRQSRNLAAVARCFNDAQGQLLTLAAQKGKEDILPANWQKRIIEKRNENHGRFWIFIGQHQVSCWECTCGLDFIKEQGGSYIIDGCPTFIPKDPTELPQFLKHQLQRTLTELQSMEVVE